MKKTIEQLKASGEVTFFDKKISDKAMIGAEVAMLTTDYTALGVAKMMKAKRLDKRVKTLMTCVYWKIQHIQRQKGVAVDAIVKLEVKDFPPLAMGVYPFSKKDARPVIVICKEG